MRQRASKLDNVSLLQQYTNSCKSIAFMINKIKYQGLKEFEPSDLPVLTQDNYAGMYAEILCRMGENEENITVALRANPLLNYKNGEELYFCKKCNICSKKVYLQELSADICDNCIERIEKLE